jgi:hypothetical protein
MIPPPPSTPPCPNPQYFRLIVHPDEVLPRSDIPFKPDTATLDTLLTPSDPTAVLTATVGRTTASDRAQSGGGGSSGTGGGRRRNATAVAAGAAESAPPPPPAAPPMFKVVTEYNRRAAVVVVKRFDLTFDGPCADGDCGYVVHVINRVLFPANWYRSTDMLFRDRKGELSESARLFKFALRVAGRQPEAGVNTVRGGGGEEGAGAAGSGTVAPGVGGLRHGERLAPALGRRWLAPRPRTRWLPLPPHPSCLALPRAAAPPQKVLLPTNEAWAKLDASQLPYAAAITNAKLRKDQGYAAALLAVGASCRFVGGCGQWAATAAGLQHQLSPLFSVLSS